MVQYHDCHMLLWSKLLSLSLSSLLPSDVGEQGTMLMSHDPHGKGRLQLSRTKESRTCGIRRQTLSLSSSIPLHLQGSDPLPDTCNRRYVESQRSPLGSVAVIVLVSSCARTGGGAVQDMKQLYREQIDIMATQLAGGPT